jgi:hypothetical protein
MTPTENKQLLNLLAATPRRLASISQDLGQKRLGFKPDEPAWSANDILAHLRASADVWGKSILAMIAQDHPTLRYVSPRTWIRKTNYSTQDFSESLKVFTQQRQELLQALTALKSAAWSRGATFTGTTSGREKTILDYVQRLISHEQEHLQQLEGLLKGRAD